jgi:hypothetical protein
MRFSASIFCLAATLAAAPAFAQAKPAQPAQPLAQGTRPAAAADAKAPGFTFGLDLNKDESERTLLPVGPIQKDSWPCTWKPDSNWGVTLDLTSRQRRTSCFRRVKKSRRASPIRLPRASASAAASR